MAELFKVKGQKVPNPRYEKFNGHEKFQLFVYKNEIFCVGNLDFGLIFKFCFCDDQ